MLISQDVQDFQDLRDVMVRDVDFTGCTRFSGFTGCGMLILRDFTN